MKFLDNGIKIHWWNMGTKTLSFNGTLKDYLKQYNISFRKLPKEYKFEPEDDLVGKNFRIKYSFGAKTVTIDVPGTHLEKILIDVIIDNQVYLGDRFQVQVIDHYKIIKKFYTKNLRS